MELCPTLEEKHTATHTHLAKDLRLLRWSQNPGLTSYGCHHQLWKGRPGASLRSPASGRLQDDADGIRNKKHVSPYHLEAGLI